ncbi:conserved hypothetical protein [Burkholderia pseudomallei 668]|nr:conserved hypothetical protein [Burkholderia pseudomallei 668]
MGCRSNHPLFGIESRRRRDGESPLSIDMSKARMPIRNSQFAVRGSRFVFGFRIIQRRSCAGRSRKQMHRTHAIRPCRTMHRPFRPDPRCARASHGGRLGGCRAERRRRISGTPFNRYLFWKPNGFALPIDHRRF